MFSYIQPLLIVLAGWPLVQTAFATPICTKRTRLAGAQLIIDSYNRVQPGESAAGFAQLPLADACGTFINPDGGPAIPVAIDATTTKAFALATRQLFSEVTGDYTDYRNGTTIIHTNVTLGVLHGIPVPVTFYADVYLIYDLADCLINKIQAFAKIPTVVAGITINPPILDQILDLRDPSVDNV